KQLELQLRVPGCWAMGPDKIERVQLTVMAGDGQKSLYLVLTELRPHPDETRLIIKKRQQDVVRFLEANRIEFEEVDITMSEEKRQWMYKNIPEDRQPAQGNPLPPQIFSDDRYCGDYDGFFESKESNTVFSFLGLKPTLASKMYSSLDRKPVSTSSTNGNDYFRKGTKSSPSLQACNICHIAIVECQYRRGAYRKRKTTKLTQAHLIKNEKLPHWR
ncbi:hypothetical protein IHE44_0009584, partial [Lamprotornis superbus]